MDRRTFLKSASMKGTAIVTASAVGTEMLHAAESIGASDVASGKRNAPKAKRLPEDLQELVKDSSLLRKPDNLTVACYTFPNYHASALHDKIYGPGWTEYNLVRSARPWFQGHAQPRGPLLGEMDESKPGTWEKYNELCKQSGIDVLIWDWYWYNNEPCLHEQIHGSSMAVVRVGACKKIIPASCTLHFCGYFTRLIAQILPFPWAYNNNIPAVHRIPLPPESLPFL